MAEIHACAAADVNRAVFSPAGRALERARPREGEARFRRFAVGDLAAGVRQRRPAGRAFRREPRPRSSRELQAVGRKESNGIFNRETDFN